MREKLKKLGTLESFSRKDKNNYYSFGKIVKTKKG
jgi:hypothetical protein